MCDRTCFFPATAIQRTRFGLFYVSVLFMLSVPFAGTSAMEPTVIPRLDGETAIDGKMSEPVWQSALVLTGFELPWNTDEKPTATELRLFHDGKRLHFFYNVEENSLLLTEPFVQEIDVASEDRVEIVFEATPPLKRYYCCEMDCKGRILDYCARFFRQFDFSWTFPSLQFAGTKTEKGYHVEGAYDLDVLRQLDILKKDNSLTIGFYRADFRKRADGSVLELWYCRVKPQTDHPEYHVPGMMQPFKLK